MFSFSSWHLPLAKLQIFVTEASVMVEEVAIELFEVVEGVEVTMVMQLEQGGRMFSIRHGWKNRLEKYLKMR